MIRQIIGIGVLLYVFALLQMSFLVHITPAGWIPNLILITVLLFSVLERKESSASLIAALVGGFFLDIFSSGMIGFWAAVLVLVSLAIKFILETYVRFPIPKRF